MKAKDVQFITEKTDALMKAPSVCAAVKEAAEKWLASDKGKEANAAYKAVLEQNIMPIDKLIEFSDSMNGVEVFGADNAKRINLHAKDLQKAGIKFCDCPACTPAQEIIAKL